MDNDASSSSCSSSATGLAKELLMSTSTEEFDLSGYGTDDLFEIMKIAYSKPLPIEEVPRHSFVVGGGKKVRAKYRPDLPKDVCDALHAIGYVDTRGASACLECQGQFKYQHDLDKDLKFVHVFPKIRGKVEESRVKIGGVDLQNMPPEMICTMCSMETFQELVRDKCFTFTQKRALLRAMKEMAARFEEFEQRMARLEKLTPEEQELFDNSLQMSEKIQYLTDKVQDLVNKGKLQAKELVIVQNEIKEKLVAMDKAIATAKAEGKKTTKLEAQRENLAAQGTRLKTAKPISAPRRFDKEIQELKKKIATLRAEMKPLVNIQEHEAKLEQLQSDNLGWYSSEKN